MDTTKARVLGGAVASLLLIACASAQTEERATVSLVKDIYPGQDQSAPSGFDSRPDQFCMVGDILFFNAFDMPNNRELWRSDGTADGTYMVKDLYSPGESNPKELTRLGDLVLFSASNLEYGRELWRSDGTEEGTLLVKDIYPGSGSSTPQGEYGTEPPRAVGFTEYNGHLYFKAFNGPGGQGRELWRTDGTTTGTVIVADICPGEGNSYPENLVVFNGLLYFKARDGTFGDAHGYELWKTDGTATGTVMVADIAPGSTSGVSGVPELTVMGDHLYFIAGSGGKAGLWRTDGQTVDMVMPWASGRGRGLSVVGQKLFFRATDVSLGNEPWVSDGTPEGTVLLRDVYPGAESSWQRVDEQNFWPSDDMGASETLFFFRAADGTNGESGELFRSDGTLDGTYMIEPYNPYEGYSGYPDDIRPLDGGRVLYTARMDLEFRRGFWISDGTLEGTYLLPGLSESVGYDDRKIVQAAPGKYYIAAVGYTNGVGEELWMLDVPPPRLPSTTGLYLFIR